MTTAASPNRRRVLRQLAGGCLISWSSFGETHPVRAADAAPLILLDAGHGGRDMGATGVAGTQEKHVTLGAAMTLRAALEAGGRYRVALTRVRDEYVALDDRVEQAQAMAPALFLSLHADTASDRSVHGAAVYTLGHEPSDLGAARLAARENASDGVSGRAMPADIARILTSLAAQDASASAFRLAHRIVRDMAKDIPVLPVPERRANFAVLRAAGVPSVLVEMGFLSNAGDEAALNDPRHRDTIARSMARAVDAWFARARGTSGRV